MNGWLGGGGVRAITMPRPGLSQDIMPALKKSYPALSNTDSVFKSCQL